MAPSRLVHEMFFMVLSSVPLERCACYVLCVVCYVLRVTCYVSHVTCDIVGSQLGGAALQRRQNSSDLNRVKSHTSHVISTLNTKTRIPNPKP